MLTFGEIRRDVARYVGTGGLCPEHEDVARFAKKVMQLLLISGSYAGKRKVSLIARSGCFSLPPEVEVPLKVRIGKRATNIWSQWLRFDQASDECDKYPSAAETIYEDGAETPLGYPLPVGGAIVGIRATCEEGGQTVLIQGKDTTGREIYTVHKGERLPGVRLTLEKDTAKYNEDVVFGEVTAVVKPRTNGYVTAFAVNPKSGNHQFLADWNPSEEKPMYRLFRVNSRACPPLLHISMLCRVRLKDNYHDNELTFFENSLAVEFAAQKIRAASNNDIQVEAAKDRSVERILNQENEYKKINGMPITMFPALSPGIIKGNIR